MIALLFGLLLAPQVQPAAHTRPMARAVEIHELFTAKNGAVLWILNGTHGFDLGRVEPLPVPITVWRSEVPMGEGTWIEFLTRTYLNMGAFRTAVPAPGERCGIEIPILPGTWWVILINQVDGQNRVLGRFEVGPRLARLAQELNQAAQRPRSAPAASARRIARPRTPSPRQSPQR